MVHKKKSPQIYWSQTETDINIKVDLLLDDMVSNQQKCTIPAP